MMKVKQIQIPKVNFKLGDSKCFCLFPYCLYLLCRILGEVRQNIHTLSFQWLHYLFHCVTFAVSAVEGTHKLSQENCGQA